MSLVDEHHKVSNNLIKFDSGDGHTLTVAEHNGRHYPDFPGLTERMNSLKTFRAREDDIWICAYPKSGTHWSYEIINMLITNKAEMSNHIKDDAMLEIQDQDAFENMASPRIIDTHIGWDLVPESVKEKECKILYIIRNPKDIAVSYYHHHKSLLCYDFEGTWSSYVDMFLEGKVDYGNWFDAVQEYWNESKTNRNILVLFYEDMLEDLIGAVKSIAKFLGYTRSEKMYSDIAEMCTFKSMKNKKAALQSEKTGSEFRSGKDTMWRKGKAGNWKETFTVAQNERFDKIYMEKMCKTDLKDRVRFQVD